MEESGGGSGSWLMTYADFITLMMIFFIVLYTFTPGVSASQFEKIIGVFKGKKGILQKESAISNSKNYKEVARAQKWEEMNEYLVEQGLDEHVKIELLEDGVLIILGEAVTFQTYSAEIMEEGKGIINQIVNIIRQNKIEPIKEIEVQGHTDNVPVRAGNRKYNSNWELGAGRAVSVLQYLTENMDISNKIVKASTYGEHQPRATNDTRKGRSENRRVEIYLKFKTSTDAINANL